MHTSCICMHTRAQKCKFRVLVILFVLISFNHMLGLIEFNFHMFSIRVSRIMCFTCLD